MAFAMRSLPWAFKGELFNIQLVQFSLDVEEARGFLPPAFSPLIVRGRAMVSLANVELDRMRLTWMPKPCGFNYRHVAFRFLIDDRRLSPNASGLAIYFVKTFTDRPLLARAADWLTYYRVSRARIRCTSTELRLDCGREHVTYKLADQEAEPRLHGPAVTDWDEATRMVKPLDHAYGITPSGQLVVTRVLRPCWPVRPLEVVDFSTSYFQTARLEFGMRVERRVPYVWQSPVPVAT